MHQREICPSPLARLALPAVALAFSAACTTANPNFCDENTPCANADAPFCDLAGEFPASDGVANRCIPTPEPDTEPAEPECDPADAFLRCDGDTLVRCSPEQTEETETCALGCNADAGACNQMVPSNISTDYLTLAEQSGEYELSGQVVFDTDAGTVTDEDGNLVPMPAYEIPPDRPSEIGLRIYTASSLSIDDAKSTGDLGLVIVVANAFTLNGDLLVRAGEMPWSNSCKGADAGKIGGMAFGCGGGGGRVNGGDGGDGYEGTPGGKGGRARFNSALRPLQGGCSGGFWPSSYTTSHGGGALQVVSGRAIALSPGAIIDANAPGAFGAGGGSGGGVLLEAPRVSLGSGSGIFANGAAGDSLCSLTDTGEGGRRSSEPAQPYDCNSIEFALSGTGGTGRVAPGAGEPAPDVETDEQLAGNGGGAAGYVRINTRDGEFVQAAGAKVEPQSTTASLQVQ